MFVYLSKKIAIPNNVRLNSVSWNQKQGYIAVGGEDGLLKVIRADSNNAAKDTANSSGKSRSTTASSNLSMNQTLEGHNGHVQVLTWNEEHQKLTSSDQNGVIIVWMLYKGSWYEEMINNRNKSVVKGMAWSSNGQKICIVYEDGAVIVGSVEGNRIWGKELKGLSLTAVQWSPDAKFLLFGSRNGEAHLYDEQGCFLKKIDNLDDNYNQAIVALDWYDGRNGYTAVDPPVLAVCFQNGKVYLLRGILDDDPIIIDSDMYISCCVWNTYGSVFALAGISPSVDRKESNVVRFYSSSGVHRKTLKVPGKEISCCTWEGGSLRIALSVDSNIYLANVRPDYKWAYFSNTVVFTDGRAGEDGVCVTFWNTASNARYSKHVKSLVSVAACGDYCVLAAENNPILGIERYVLYVCNAVSTPVDTKYLDLEPRHLAINGSTVFVASASGFLLWNFRNPRNFALGAGRPHPDRSYHVDDSPTGVSEPARDPGAADEPGLDGSALERRDTGDPICSLCATDKLLLVGRESGAVQQYCLPQVGLSRRHATGRRPLQLAVNSDSTRAAAIDEQGVLRLLELDGAAGRERDLAQESEEEVRGFERKDAWAVRWAEDNPRLLAVVEKSRMYVFRGLEPEEPIACSGYVCSFDELVVRCALLDELVRRPEDARAELLLDLEIKPLRDTRELLARVGPREAEEFVRERPHPRLWRLLAEHALRRLDLDAAESAMVRYTDYLGIRFVKRLRGIPDPALRRAEVLAYLGEHDAAERAYLELDRRDLAIGLRQRLADYPRALQLMSLGAGACSDAQRERVHALWGEELAARQQWAAAREHLERGNDLGRLLDCHYHLEDYEGLAATATRLPDGSDELRRAARMLASAGMCQEAVACHVRCSDARQAVETCVRLNRWDTALELARTWRLAGIGELLGKYAGHLLASGRRLQAVELYRKAECPLEAARLLLELAREQAAEGAGLLRLKKLYVLAGLLGQEHLEGAGARSPGGEGARVLEAAWRGAEAYHFLLLVHRQLYAAEPEAAMRTALRLREYEDLLDQELVYALLALASCACGALATCSRAFVRLEGLDPRYEELALEIFGTRPPRDARAPTRAECLRCESLVPDYCVGCPNCGSSFAACVVSGRSIMDQASAWLCSVCKHRASSERAVVNANGCPLCHSIVTYM